MRLGLKIAVSGKGGVGKTTIAGSIVRNWALRGLRVLAVDADPVNHLAIILDIPKERQPTPLSRMNDLIEERTGVAPGNSFGKLFRMNPKVDDIPENYAATSENGAKLLVLGTIERACTGCFCPENALLRTLIDHLVLRRDDYLIVDMEAGLEHLGRGSSRGIDLLIVVVEPGQRSIETAERIRDLAKEMEIRRVETILNRIDSRKTEEIMVTRMGELDIPIIGSVPYDPLLEEADLRGVSPYSISDTSPALDALSEIADRLRKIG